MRANNIEQAKPDNMILENDVMEVVTNTTNDLRDERNFKRKREEGVVESLGLDSKKDDEHIKDTGKKLRESSRSREELLEGSESKIGKKISELPSEYIEMIFSILEQKRALGKGEKGDYTEEELEECYELLFEKAEEKINPNFIERYIVREEEKKNNIDFLNTEETLNIIEKIIGEVNKLYEAEDIEECLHKIKEGLKLCNSGINIGNYYEQEYELFLKLGDIYYRGEDRLDYPKAVGIYQYVLNIIDKLPDRIDKEGRKRKVENKIGLVEEKFIRQAREDKILPEGYTCEGSLEKIREYKAGLEEHRKLVKGELKRIEDLGIKEGEEELDEEGLQKRAEEVERIYGEIREYFIGDNGLIKQLLNDCIKELGGLPRVIDKETGKEREVKYAAFGKGSMALGTMTPWSDIEWGILIEEGLGEEKAKEVKEYFRSLTTLMYIKVTNFGEGVLNYQGVKELNDLSRIGSAEDYWFVDMLSPKGFCFDATLPDGCKTPLGRQGHMRVIRNEGREELIRYKDYELIGSISEMLKFQEDASWEEHDMTLVQALWHIVPIIDDKGLIKKYQIRLGVDREKIKEKSIEILKKDNIEINPFGQIISGDKEGQILKVKREIYRFPDRILIALGDCLLGLGNNTWKIVRLLVKREEGEDRRNLQQLQIALSIATELRLRTYAHNNSRKEDLSALARYESNIKELKEADTQGVFYIKDIRILYRFYYIILPLSIMVSSTQDKSELREGYKKVNFIGTTPIIKGCVYKRFIKYYDALREFEKTDYVTDIFLKSNMAALYYLVGRIKEALELCEDIYIYVKLRHKEEYVTIASSLSNIGNILQNLGRYEEALERHQESLEMTRRIYKGDHRIIAFSLSNLRDILGKLGRYEEALERHQESLAMMRRIYKGDHRDIASSLTNIGNILQSLGWYKEALERQQESLGMMRRVYKGNHPDIASALSNIGNILQSLGQYEEALERHQESLEMRKRIYKSDHPAIASSLHNIGMTLQSLGRYKEASERQQESLDMSRRIYKGDHPDVAYSLNNIGSILQSLGRYEEALKSYQESFEIRKRVYKSDHSDIASALSNIGNILQSLGRYKEALEKQQESLDMMRKIYKGDHIDIVASLNNVGNILQNLGRHEEALARLQESLDMSRRIYKGDHPAIAASLSNTGAILGKIGRYEEALEKSQESLDMSRRIYKGDHPGIAYSLNNIGAILQSLGRHEEAIKSCQESLEMRKRIYKGDHADITFSLNNIGNILYDLEQYEEALERQQESLEMSRRIYKVDHPVIAASLSNVGNVLAGLRRYREALERQQESLEMMRKIYKGDHPDIASLLNNIGSILENLERYKEALESYNKGLAMQKKIFKGDHPNTANLLFNIGNVLGELEQYNEALEKLKESLEMRNRIHKGDHPDIASSLNNIGKFLQSLGRYEQAYNLSKQSYNMCIRLKRIHHPDFQIVQSLFFKCTMLLGNKEIVLNNIERGYELYSSIGIERNSVVQNLYNLAINSWITKELDLSISCYEVLSKKLALQDRGVKHNLACMYHAKAISLYKNNNIEQYEKYISKSKEVFELAINLESDKPVSSALHTEYSMFLVKYHDTSNAEEYKRIESLLSQAIEFKGDRSGLKYNQLEKATVVESLQDLLNTKESVSVAPYLLAYYLLVKLHKLHNHEAKAKEILVNFATLVMAVKKEESEVPLTLLIAAYKELGFNFQARIYQEILDKIVCCKQEGIEK